MGLWDNLLDKASRFLKRLAEEAATEAEDPALERLNAKKQGLLRRETVLRQGRELSMGLTCLSGSGLLAAAILAWMVEGHWTLTCLLVGLTATSLWQAVQAARLTRELVVVLSQQRGVSREIEERREAHRRLLEAKVAERLKGRVDRLIDFVLDEDLVGRQAVQEIAQEPLVQLADGDLPPMFQERARLARYLLQTDRASLAAQIEGLTRRLAEAEGDLDLKKTRVLETRLSALEGRLHEVDRLRERLEILDEELAAIDAQLEHLEVKLLVEQSTDPAAIEPILANLASCLATRALPSGLSGTLLPQGGPSEDGA